MSEISLRYVVDAEELVDRLRYARQVARLTQAELAQAIGINRATLGKIESGDRRLQAVDFIAWCAACGVSLELIASNEPLEAVIRRKGEPYEEGD